MSTTSSFPVLNELVGIIAHKQPLQKKNLQLYLAECDPEFLTRAEIYLQQYTTFLEQRGTELEFVADAYLTMVRDILFEQTRFLKSRQYRFKTVKETQEHVYDNPPYMYKYMIGVAVSQFLWRNHRDMFLFLQKHLKQQSGERYLEVGPGHGLFLLEALQSEQFQTYKAIDISPTSLDISQHFVKHCYGQMPAHLTFELQNIEQYTPELAYDFLTMGEVLEHVEQPQVLLQAVFNLLKPGGKAYLSTCANCPVIDHIYLYETIDAIREQMYDAGLTLVDELVVSIDNIPEEQWQDKRANLSYACIVTK